MDIYAAAMSCWAIVLIAAIWMEYRKPKEDSNFSGFGIWITMIGFLGCLMFKAAETHA